MDQQTSGAAVGEGQEMTETAKPPLEPLDTVDAIRLAAEEGRILVLSSSSSEDDYTDSDHGEDEDDEGEDEEDEGDWDSDEYETSELDAAIDANDLERVKQILKPLDEDARQELLTSRNIYGAFPLFVASELGRVEIARYLLEKRADVNAAKENGVTSLFIASQNGHLELAWVLLEEWKAEVNKARDSGASPLLIACQYGRVDMGELLLSFGADVNQPKIKDAATPLFIACQYGHEPMVKLLLQNSGNVNQAKNDGATPLFITAQKGFANIARVLLAARAEVDLARNDDITPLAFVCQKGHLETAAILIQARADVNTRDSEGCTPLITAAQHAKDKIVRLLLEQGADPTAISNFGQSALAAAVWYAASGSVSQFHRAFPPTQQQHFYAVMAMDDHGYGSQPPVTATIGPSRLKTIELLVAVSPASFVHQLVFLPSLGFRVERLIQRRLRRGSRARVRAHKLIHSADRILQSRKLTLRDYKACWQRYQTACTLSPSAPLVARIRLMQTRFAQLQQQQQQQREQEQQKEQEQVQEEID